MSMQSNRRTKWQKESLTVLEHDAERERIRVAGHHRRVRDHSVDFRVERFPLPLSDLYLTRS